MNKQAEKRRLTKKQKDGMHETFRRGGKGKDDNVIYRPYKEEKVKDLVEIMENPFDDMDEDEDYEDA